MGYPKMDLTPQMADYLKSIYLLQAHFEQVPTSALADRLEITPASVTGMVRKLADLGLLDHEPYRGVHLTRDGEILALKVIRAHRLWEAYLVKAVGLAWDEAHVEAERLEHVLSDRLAERLDQMLGHPALDPHGHPIPTREGHIDTVEGVPLTELDEGMAGTVVQIRDETPELLRYLADLNVYPGKEITVVEVAPFDGPFHVTVSGKTQVVGRGAAAHIVVKEDRQ